MCERIYYQYTSKEVSDIQIIDSYKWAKTAPMKYGVGTTLNGSWSITCSILYVRSYIL